MTKDRAVTAFWSSLPFIALILFCVIQCIRGVFYDSWVGDIFIPLEGVEHLRHGHLPHRDFSTPVGILYYLIHYLPASIAGLSARTIVYANLIVGLLVALVTVFLGRQRLPLWAASIAALYLGMVATSPRQIGQPFVTVTYNAAYNRYGWALMGVVALIVVLRATDGKRSTEWIDGIVTGLLLAMLFFIKATYFAAGLGLVAVAMITTRRLTDWRFPLAIGAVVLVTLATVQLTTGLVGLYIGDLRNAAAATTGSPFRPTFALQLLAHTAWGGVLVLVLGLLGEWNEDRPWAWLPRTMAALATALAGVAIGIQNHPELENPLVPIAALITASGIFARKSAGRVDESRPVVPRNFAVASMAAFLGLALIPFAQDTAAVFWTAAGPRATGPEVAWLDQTRLQDLRLRRQAVQGGDSQVLTNDVQFASLVADGTALLRRRLNGRHDAVVLPLTWSNPFPVLLGLPPVKYELAWWDHQRTFSSTVKPDADRLFAAVDYIMVPKRGYGGLAITVALQQIYATELERDFMPVENTEAWTLLARRSCNTRMLC